MRWDGGLLLASLLLFGTTHHIVKVGIFLGARYLGYQYRYQSCHTYSKMLLGFRTNISLILNPSWHSSHNHIVKFATHEFEIFEDAIFITQTIAVIYRVQTQYFLIYLSCPPTHPPKTDHQEEKLMKVHLHPAST